MRRLPFIGLCHRGTSTLAAILAAAVLRLLGRRSVRLFGWRFVRLLG